MANLFHKKVVIITGSARGIGKNIARKFAQAGAKTIIADRDDTRAEKTVKEITGEGHFAGYYRIDLADVKQAEEMIFHTLREQGHIDVLINNAKSGIRTAPLTEHFENWDNSMDVSLKATFFMSQALIREKKDSTRSTSILNISSVAAKMICGESAAYHTSKSGLENLTRYLAVHGGPRGVRVNAIRPGFIVQDEHRDFFSSPENASYRKGAEQCHPLRCVGSSDDVANACLFLCSDQAAFITGQILTIDGGLTLQDPYWLTANFKDMNRGTEF